ncbi:MAG: prolipoprotein diacylglyceryl transferase [Cryomorphaceae bacterium]|jgi:phosphatidylglycerol:prolipoprotein diacylglycerol transferase|nr:prolipoprotein diacylglyceryl transferase [Cryomorphaceae bacterium]
MVAAINWDVDSQLIDGYNTPNLYGLLFVTGLIIGYFVVRKMFRKDGISDEMLDKLVLFMVVATIVGARLGHVFFYGPYWDEVSADGVVLERGYFSHPGDILKVWEGGLASHGAAIVILISLYIYSRRVIQKPYLWMLDRISAPIAIGGTFIRLGNLVNHEMVGDVTTVPWGFRFMHHDCIPPFECSWNAIPVRHPAQLYEAICYFAAFIILMFLYWKKDLWKRPGVVFGSFLILIWGARFMVEFVKLGQTARDEYLFLNTGQLLSIPLVIAGVILLYRGLKKPIEL